MNDISSERLEEMLAYTPTYDADRETRVWYRDLRLALTELCARRAAVVDAVAWSLVWNDRYGVNAETTFKHEDRAREYAEKCGDPKPRVVPLYLYPRNNEQGE